MQMKYLLFCALHVLSARAFAPNEPQFQVQGSIYNDLVLSAPDKCSSVDLYHYAHGSVNLKTFSPSCFEEIDRRRYNPTSLTIYEAHLAKNDVISKLKWNIVTYISGVATDNMKFLPWSKMSKLEGLELDFDKLGGASTFPISVVSTIPRSVKYLDIRGGRNYSSTIEKLLGRLATGLKKFGLSGSHLPTVAPHLLAGYFRNNAALKWLAFEIEDEFDCKNSFDIAARIMVASSSSVDTLQLLCKKYDASDVEMILNSIKSSPRTEIFLKTGSNVYANWMKKMIEVGEVAYKRNASVSIGSPGINGMAEISFRRIVPPSAPNDIEVKMAWIDMLFERAEKYSGESDFRRIFNGLFTGYYGQRRGIRQFLLDDFEKFIASHPMNHLGALNTD